MSVTRIPCGPPANRSEEMAVERCVAALRNLGDSGRWLVLSNLASSSTPLRQSDELDMVCIGPRGVLLIEDKHWDAAWMRDHREVAEAEAEKLTAKAKRLAGRVRSILRGAAPRVEQWLLLTRDVGASGLDPVRGVPVRTLRSLADAFRSLPTSVLSFTQVDVLVQGLEPRTKVQLDGRIRKLAEYRNLELCSPKEDGFHRVYRGIHQRTMEKVVVHVYDLSATDERDARRLAEREFRSMQLLQKCRWIPRFRESFQDLPDYPGEMCFFSLFDPEAPTVKRRATDASWSDEQRVGFAASALDALAEMHGLTDENRVPVVHRNLSPETVLVAARNQPVFLGFHLARLPATQTVGAVAPQPPSGPWVPPELQKDGLVAASKASDVFGLCATLMAAFDGRGEPIADRTRRILATGCVEDSGQRGHPGELAVELRALLPKQEVPPGPPTADPLRRESECPAADYWCEGVEVEFRRLTLRVVTRLGGGGVGQTFKVEHVDPRSGENYGTYVAKVIRTQEAGALALRAYQRVRPHSVHPGLATVFEAASEWQADRVMALLKWVDGESLDGLRGVLGLAAEENGEDSVEALLRRWLQEVCSALSVLHTQCLVHGDVSPRNLIHHHGSLTLTDYDLVTRAGEPAWGVGARAYCSPEAERRGPVQPSDDLFALAASLFDAAFDRPAFPSPSGALDKNRGLDWRPGDKEALGSLVEFFELATNADRSRRFADASAALSWLRKSATGQQESPQPTQLPPASAPAEQAAQSPRGEKEVPWLESLLRVYPGSPHGNRETRGLDSEFATLTYVETPLENELFEVLRSRRTRLVILCGNAGDGKTALLQRLAAKFGRSGVTSGSRVWEVRTDDGLFLRANLDGAAALQERGANQLLDELFAPFLNGPPAEDRAHLLAINDGRLLEWLHSHIETVGESPLTRALSAALAGDDGPATVPPHVRFISLNHRSLVGGRTANSEDVSTEFLDALVNALLGGDRARETWSPCRACTAWERCTAGPTAHRLLEGDQVPDSPEGRRGRRMRRRLAEALQAVHQRGNIHITARELRGVISYILFGVKSCRDLHGNPGERAARPGDMAFDPESAFRQGDLLRELAELDPALEAHPQLDRWLIGHSGREIRGAGPAYRDLQLPSARRRAFFEWTTEEIELIAGSSEALGLATSQHLELFRSSSLRDSTANREVCRTLCRGISQLENLPAAALRREGKVPLRIPSRTPTETIFWVEKPLDRFRLEPEWPPIKDVAIPVLPRRLRLLYTCADQREEVLAMGYELFHALLNLAEGEQLSELRSDDLFANLELFTQRLAHEDETHLLAWHPKADEGIFRLGLERRTAWHVLKCETTA